MKNQFRETNRESYFKISDPVEFEVVDPPPGFGEPRFPRNFKSPVPLSSSSFREGPVNRKNHPLSRAFQSFCEDMLEERPANTAFAAPAYTG